MTRSLKEQLSLDPFAGYAYAYPHKTSYRTLDPAIRLQDAWRQEAKDSLYLYVHLPFCEMRCGFCNLFTTVQPKNDFVTSTLNAIARQSSVVAREIGAERISQLAFGGGTPSFLSVKELDQLFEQLDSTWPIDWQQAQLSFEVSPATISPDKLQLLKSRHVDRISMGVQSFVDDDLKQLGRPQSIAEVERAIEAIKSADFPVFNLDLIYGVAGQTPERWQTTLHRVLRIRPTEIYLYPLYVRELTGLQRIGERPSDHRPQLYSMARDQLSSAGYEQISMRLFRQPGPHPATDYCCQNDGMIGLGPGARSYTRQLHYSSEYAVGRQGVKSITTSFNAKSSDQHAHADYGVSLDESEQKRRYLIKSILRKEGIAFEAYRQRFHSVLYDDFPQLSELLELELAVDDGLQMRLNPAGLSLSDAIGPWLYSADVVAQMEAFDLA